MVVCIFMAYLFCGCLRYVKWDELEKKANIISAIFNNYCHNPVTNFITKIQSGHVFAQYAVTSNSS